MSESENYLFLGSPRVAADILSGLLDNGCPITTVVTKEPRRRSRNAQASVTAVEDIAINHKLEVFYSLSDISLEKFDLGIVVAYGKIISESTLEKLPLVNLHFSLLPSLRGAAPVQRSVLNGDSYTGVTLMQIASELDAGDIYDQIEVKIDDNDDIDLLFAKLAKVGIDILVSNLTVSTDVETSENKNFSVKNLPIGRQQSGEITWAPKITDDELQVLPSDEVLGALNKIKLNRAYFIYQDKKIKIVSAAKVHSVEITDKEQLFTMRLIDKKLLLRLKDGYIELITLVPQSKSLMSGLSFFNGYLKPGL